MSKSLSPRRGKGRSGRGVGNQSSVPSGMPQALRQGWRPATDPEATSLRYPGTMSPHQVLDLHADLHKMLASPTPFMREIFVRYALEDAKVAAWQASHLHPATSTRDLEPWVSSLGKDLFGATTYQVTAEMVDLALALQETTPDLNDVREEDLPSDAGFMWLDKPIPRPSVEDLPGQEPLLLHAVSWQRVDNVPIRIGIDAGDQDLTPEERSEAEHKAAAVLPATKDLDGIITAVVPGLRVREWGWNDRRDITPRPLQLIGQNTCVLSKGVTTPLPEMRTLHMLWILMQMEIVTSRTVPPGGRQGRKRSANLSRPEVRVITLRRPAHGEPRTFGHREVDWSCSWLVRGHWRRAPHGGTFADGRDRTWIAPYIKGPDGLPLRAADILYKLAR